MRFYLSTSVFEHEFENQIPAELGYSLKWRRSEPRDYLFSLFLLDEPSSDFFELSDFWGPSDFEDSSNFDLLSFFEEESPLEEEGEGVEDFLA
jgi:hypothetical protein